jgi:hypothetical protein
MAINAQNDDRPGASYEIKEGKGFAETLDFKNLGQLIKAVHVSYGVPPGQTP